MENLIESKSTASRLSNYFAGLVLLLTMLAGGISVIWSVSTNRSDRLTSLWSFDSIVSGQSALALSAELLSTPFPSALADAQRAANWLVTGSLGIRVRRGCDAWLFLEDELTVHPNRLSNMRQRMDTLVKVRDLLQQHGVQLIITTVPDKTRIQHHELCKVYRPASANDRLNQWEAGLRQRGIHLASLIEPLEALTSSGGEQPFLKADTHWSQSGAQAAAEAILGTIEKNNIVLTPKQAYVLDYGALQRRTGDLVRLAGIDWLPQSLQPPTDWIRPMRIQAEQSEQTFSQSKDASQDLFGDTNLPTVALLGTSFSRTSSFAALLEMTLQTSVPNFALDGGDFWGSAKQYLQSDAYRKTPPRVVIWEVPERVLQMPISKEEEAWISGLSNLAAQKNR